MMQSSHQPYYENFRQKKRLSQVFLSDYSAIADVFDDLDLKGKIVLEIGAGEGAITKVLSKKAKKVIALEIDKELCTILKEKAGEMKNVEIICADAMQASLDYEVIIGFLPYHISSPLLFKILNSKFKEAVLCVQKEFALRLVSEVNSGDYSKLSVMAQNLADIDYLQTVPAAAFSPVPKVDSALVYLVKNPKGKLDEAVVSALFQHKNQSIKKALSHSTQALNKTKQQILDFCKKINSAKRARTLSLEELHEICAKYDAFFS
ncbi:ribosomal RNA small subunit methyltransferase A [Candidatus Micrarchaeota archaeon]|nr:ribosomal RNA small subunit methyltransferase A [Candidatus Micrarchaeota archaeon]